MLQFDIWQLPVRRFLPKLFTVQYLSAFCQTAQLRSETGHNKESDIAFSLKILTGMIRAHGGRAECCLNLNIGLYEIALVMNFK